MILSENTSPLTLHMLGNDLSQPQKTALYFSLSAKDSLSTPPFCHPATYLYEKGYRVLSVTLPHHEDNARPFEIKQLWGKDPYLLETFIEDLEQTLLPFKELFLGKLYAIGLSRGAFIAMHIATKLDWIDSILGFAPMTYLEPTSYLDLSNYIKTLHAKRIRFYIGHNDTRVSTSKVLELTRALQQTAIDQKLLHPRIDCILKPSTGRDGHGTLDPIFQEGIDWLIKE